MDSRTLKKSFDKFYETPIGVWEHFVDRCEIVTFKKEEVIKQPFDIENYFYFILEGSAGIFLWHKNNFVCIDLIFENQFFGDYMSLLSSETTPLQTMAIEKSDMLKITKRHFFELGKRSLGQHILRIAAEASFMAKQQQQIDLLTKTANERYRELIDKFPSLMARIPQKYIASYLGITPQSLSRLKNS